MNENSGKDDSGGKNHLQVPGRRNSKTNKKGSFDASAFSTAKKIIVEDTSMRTSNATSSNFTKNDISGIPSPVNTIGKNVRRRSKNFWGSQEIELGGIDGDRGGDHIALDRTSHASI